MTDTFLTRCPQCQTIFRLTASQLKKAKGKVRCGSCALVFNAQGHLIDPPPATAQTPTRPTAPPAAIKPPPKPLVSTPPKEDDFFDLYAKPPPADPNRKPPQFIDSIVDDRSRYNNLDKIGKIEIPGEIDPGMHTINRDKTIFTPPPVDALPPAAPKPANPYEDTADKENPTDIDDLEGINALYEVADAEMTRPTEPTAGEEIVLDRDNLPIDDFDLTDLPTSDAQAKAPSSKLDLSYIEESFANDKGKSRQKPVASKTKASRQEPQMPFSLRSTYAELEDEPRSIWLTALASFALLLLVCGLLFQTLLFRSTQLVEHFPKLTGPMSWFCAHLPCRYSGERDLSQIELVSRDVRSHPTAKNALLINVTIINQARFKQPYPTMLLSLSNLNGQIVARRQFQPQEYLDKVYTPFLRMEPETPVHISLAVIDPGEDAMNFEFSFQ